MISAINLSKAFGDFIAVRDISLEVKQGELITLLGPNGAGKTTTVRMLSAILKPTKGYARLAGYDTVKDAKTIRHLIGVLTEFPGLYSRMKALQYLKFFGELQGMPTKDIADRSEMLLKRFELWDARDREIGKFSKGMKQKLTLVRAMLHDPYVLFLDEPTSAMDPQSAKLVRNAIMELRQDQRTVVLCTHNLNEAELLADRIAIVRQGEIVVEGSPTALKHQLLGTPLMEIRIASQVNGLVDYLAERVDVVSHGDTWVRYTVPNPNEFNPTLINELTHQNLSIITLSEVQQSLEDVYLKIVEQ